jgi:hypothetical protein
VQRLRRIVKIVSLALCVAAVVEQLRLPAGERTWEGEVVGFVPYDFRMPTLERARSRWWNPDADRLFMPTVFGVGWTVNVGRRMERCVVALRLVRVAFGERRDGAVELIALPEIGGDRDPVTRARVRPREGPRAHPALEPHRGGIHPLRGPRSLPVAELADVEVASTPSFPSLRSHPRKMSLAACIKRWPSTTRCPALGYRLLPT